MLYAVVIAIGSFGWLYQADQLSQKASVIETELQILLSNTCSLADIQDLSTVQTLSSSPGFSC